MTGRILSTLFVLVPLIVLFGGMAMTPLCYIAAMVIICATPRAQLQTPASFYPRYTFLLAGLALLLLPSLITSLWSNAPGISISTGLRAVFLCTISAVAFIYSKALPSPSNKVLACYGAALVLVSLLIAQEALFNGGLIKFFYDLAHKDYARFMIKNINRGLCALAILVWPFLAACYERGYKRKGWIVVALAFFAIMTMHSLSAKLGIVTGATAFLILNHSSKTTAYILAIAMPLLLLAFPWFLKTYETILLTHPFIQHHLAESEIHRLHIWHILGQLISERPWLGWGIDTTRILPLTAEQLAYLSLDIPPLHPHNPSLQLLVEGGLVGLTLAVIAFAFLLREWAHQTAANSVHRASAGAIIFAYVATNISSYSIWQSWWIATLCMTALLWRWISLERPQLAQ